MKYLFSVAIFILFFSISDAQSVGIGTASPNSKAQLEISSTTKGLLVPSMTTTQRFDISSPPNGLLVYDTDKNEFYHYNGSGWTPIINGTYWTRPITNRDRISTTDSVGIGTSSPTDRLDVNGNIRSRNNVEVAGTTSTNGLLVSGNTVAAGSALISGLLSSNSGIDINNPGNTLQFKDQGSNKVFLQVSGDNLRLGTNSGNTSGKFVVRNNGADRFSIDADGDVNYTGKITSTNTGTANMTPVGWGITFTVSGTPLISRGTANCTVNRLGLGLYRITCADITTTSAVMCTPRATGVNVAAIAYNGYADVYTRRSDTGEDIDQAFQFLIY